jgi:copper(I)-binding protein
MFPRTPARILFAALLLATTGVLHAQAPAVTIHDAWVRQPMGSRKMTGAFAVVENTGSTPRAIVAASADVSDKVELHEMTNDGGMMRMSPVGRIVVPAGGRVELRPGSFHVMLFELKKKPAAGEKVRLSLTLDDGTTVTAEATVRSPGDPR